MKLISDQSNIKSHELETLKIQQLTKSFSNLQNNLEAEKNDFLASIENRLIFLEHSLGKIEQTFQCLVENQNYTQTYTQSDISKFSTEENERNQFKNKSFNNAENKIEEIEKKIIKLGKQNDISQHMQLELNQMRESTKQINQELFERMRQIQLISTKLNEEKLKNQQIIQQLNLKTKQQEYLIKDLQQQLKLQITQSQVMDHSNIIAQLKQEKQEIEAQYNVQLEELTKECVNQGNIIEELQSKLQKFQNMKYPQNNEEIECVMFENQQLSQELDLKDQKLKEGKLNLQHMQRKVASLEQKIRNTNLVDQSELNSKIDQYEQQITGINEQLNEKNDYIILMEQKNKEFQQNFSKQQTLIQGLKQKQGQQQESMVSTQKLTKQNQELKDQVEECSSRIKNLQELLLKSQDDTSQLETQISDLQSANDILLKENNELKNKLQVYLKEKHIITTKYKQIERSSKKSQEKMNNLPKTQNCIVCLKIQEEADNMMNFLQKLAFKVGGSSERNQRDKIQMGALSQRESPAYSSAASPTFSYKKSIQYDITQKTQTEDNNYNHSNLVLTFYRMKRVIISLIQDRENAEKQKEFSEIKTPSVFDYDYFQDSTRVHFYGSNYTERDFQE